MQFLDLIGMDLSDLVDTFQDEIAASYDVLLEAVQ